MSHPEHLHELDRLTDRAFDEAIRLEHSFVGQEHFLLALVHPSQDTPAAEALRSCGVSYEDVAAELDRALRNSDPPPRPFDPEAGIILATMGATLVARAEGIAVGLGDSVPRDEHALLAYLWEPGEEWPLSHCGTTRKKVFERLRELGVGMPVVPLPPTRVAPSGRHQRVDVAPQELRPLLSELLTLLPEDAEWGWNVDPATNRAWIAATSDEFDLEERVRQGLAQAAQRRA